MCPGSGWHCPSGEGRLGYRERCPQPAGPGLLCSIFHPSLAPWPGHHSRFSFSKSPAGHRSHVLLRAPFHKSSRTRGRRAVALPEAPTRRGEIALVTLPGPSSRGRCRHRGVTPAPAPLPSPLRAVGSAPDRHLTDGRRSQWRAGHVRAAANGCRRAARGRGRGAGAARCEIGRAHV